MAKKTTVAATTRSTRRLPKTAMNNVTSDTTFLPLGRPLKGYPVQRACANRDRLLAVAGRASRADR